MKIPKEELDNLVALRKQGKTLQEIADIYNVTPTIIMKHLNEFFKEQ